MFIIIYLLQYINNIILDKIYLIQYIFNTIYILCAILLFMFTLLFIPALLHFLPNLLFIFFSAKYFSL